MLIRRRPPTVVFAGKRGVGKSSTLNHLFGLGLATDAAVECTLAPHVAVVDDGRDRMRVVDMPGIAANRESGARYATAYRSWVRRADTFVWITQANVRAYRQDQLFLATYASRLRSRSRVVIAVSRFDSLFAEGADAPDPGLLEAKVRDVRKELGPLFTPHVAQVDVQPYSVATGWNVDLLRRSLRPRTDPTRLEYAS